MQGPSQTKSIPRLFCCDFVPARDPRGGDERTSEHKLIKDGSAPTPARQRAIMFGFRFRVTELVLNLAPLGPVCDYVK